MAKPRRGGYIWRGELARLRRVFDSQRKLIDEMTAALQGPPSKIILLACALQLAQAINEGLMALHEIEMITAGADPAAGEEPTEE